MFAVVQLLFALSAPPELVSRLDRAADAYYRQMVALAPLTGRDVAFDYYRRLLDDRTYVNDTDIPDGYDAPSYAAFLQRMAALDIELTTRLETGDYGNIATLRGMHEILIRSSVDGTMQPCALYVPASYNAARPAPLVVLLHGHPQTESSLVAPPYVEALAESTGSVVIAPYGRGNYDYAGAALNDVYDAYDTVTSALSIDPRRRYLAGYSMGGFSVFIVAPARPNAWSAILSISGGIMGHDIARVLPIVRAIPLYVVTGTSDDSIPTEYTQRTAHFFANAGASVSLYVNPGGTHRVITNLSVLRTAWSDMHAGIARELQPDLRWNSAPTAAAAKSVIF